MTEIVFPKTFDLIYFVIIPIILCIYQTFNCIVWIRYVCGLSVTNKISNNLELTVQSNPSNTETPKSIEISRNNSHNKSFDNEAAFARIDGIIKVLTTLSITVGTIYIWMFTMFNYGYVLWSFNIIKNTFINRYRCGYTVIINALSRCLLYLCYIRRLYFTFQSSFLEISYQKYVVLIVVLMISGIVAVIYFVVVTILKLEYLIYLISFDFMEFSKWGLFAIWDLFWGLYLMINYISKLKRVIKMTRMQHEYIAVVRKLSILMTSAVISTQILVITFIFNPLYGQIMVYIDVIINTFSLLYSYDIYNNKYQKHCCVCIYIFSFCK